MWLGLGKQVLSIQNTLVYIMVHIFFCMSYSQSVHFIGFLCIYDDILDTISIQITDKKLLHFKHSKSDQILRIHKTNFPRPSHIYLIKIAFIVLTYCSSIILDSFSILFCNNAGLLALSLVLNNYCWQLSVHI